LKPEQVKGVGPSEDKKAVFEARATFSAPGAGSKGRA